MENLGKNNSNYYFEIENHIENVNMFFGVSPKLEGLNESNYTRDDVFLLFCSDGEIHLRGQWKKYASKVLENLGELMNN